MPLIVIVIFVGLLWCWVMATYAVYALPCLIGIAAGVYAFDTGAGVAGATVVGAFATLIALTVARLAFALARGPARAIVALVFVIPSMVVAYHLAEDILHDAIPSPSWRMVILVAFAVLAGMGAFAKLTKLEQDERQL